MELGGHTLSNTPTQSAFTQLGGWCLFHQPFLYSFSKHALCALVGSPRNLVNNKTSGGIAWNISFAFPTGIVTQDRRNTHPESKQVREGSTAWLRRKKEQTLVASWTPGLLSLGHPQDSGTLQSTSHPGFSHQACWATPPQSGCLGWESRDPVRA